ncbi:MAG: hypothetical protein QM621_07605 [Aeromicrobium sp.]|uniref:hypothetical protein n=1 Tax=Aeromicrobium sp. TaxID=1871063 RepID=UPI0039E5B8ED
MSTRAKVVIFSCVFGLLVVAGIAATVVFLVIQQNRKEDVAEADRVAAEYLEAVADFREEQAERIGRKTDDPEAALEMVEDAQKEIPELGAAPEYGRENSDDYAEAGRAEERAADDLDALSGVVGEALGTGDFVAAATAALDGEAPQGLLGTGPFADGQPVRDTAIPGMQAIKDDFEAVEVPDGFEDAAEATSAALQHVIDGLGAMAASLDGGQSYSFEYDAEYNEALEAVFAAVDDTESTLDDAVEAFGAGEEVEDPSDDSQDESVASRSRP